MEVSMYLASVSNVVFLSDYHLSGLREVRAFSAVVAVARNRATPTHSARHQKVTLSTTWTYFATFVFSPEELRLLSLGHEDGTMIDVGLFSSSVRAIGLDTCLQLEYSRENSTLALDRDQDDPDDDRSGEVLMAASIKFPDITMMVEVHADDAQSGTCADAEEGSPVYEDMQGAVPLAFIVTRQELALNTK